MPAILPYSASSTPILTQLNNLLVGPSDQLSPSAISSAAQTSTALDQVIANLQSSAESSTAQLAELLRSNQLTQRSVLGSAIDPEFARLFPYADLAGAFGLEKRPNFLHSLLEPIKEYSREISQILGLDNAGSRADHADPGTVARPQEPVTMRQGVDASPLSRRTTRENSEPRRLPYEEASPRTSRRKTKNARSAGLLKRLGQRLGRGILRTLRKLSGE